MYFAMLSASTKSIREQWAYLYDRENDMLLAKMRWPYLGRYWPPIGVRHGII